MSQSKKKKGLLRTGYVNEFDQFFHDFDKDRPMPTARIEEENKLKAVFAKRDKPVAESTPTIWKEF